MVNSNRFFLLLLIFLTFQLTSFAQKDSSRIKKLSKEADVILTGKVKQKKSSWNANKTRIYTKTTLQVEEILKGNKNGNSVEVIYPGGEVGDVGEIYTHTPKFEANEEVLVFLKKNTKSMEYRVLNGVEGKIKVISDTKTKEKVTKANVSLKEIKSQIKTILNEE